MFKDELQFFIDNQEELVRKYNGKVLTIKGRQVVGVYNSALEAYLKGQEKYELGTFMIQKCEPGPSAYTVEIAHQQVVYA